MAFTEQKFFYELLVRGGPAGVLGAHAAYLERTLKDGVVIAEKIGDAMPVAMAKNDPGIPLATVLGDLNAQALATIEARVAEIAALTDEKRGVEAERDAALAQGVSLTGERDQARARIAELETQLAAALEGAPAPVVEALDVPKWKIRVGLTVAGMLPEFETWLAKLPALVRGVWDDAPSVHADSPFVPLFAAHFKLTEDEVGAMLARFDAITQADLKAAAGM